MRSGEAQELTPIASSHQPCRARALVSDSDRGALAGVLKNPLREASVSALAA